MLCKRLGALRSLWGACDLSMLWYYLIHTDNDGNAGKQTLCWEIPYPSAYSSTPWGGCPPCKSNRLHGATLCCDGFWDVVVAQHQHHCHKLFYLSDSQYQTLGVTSNFFWIRFETCSWQHVAVKMHLRQLERYWRTHMHNTHCSYSTVCRHLIN